MVIVGAGVAGCAAAATALELGRRVAVLEAGSGGPLPARLRSSDLTEARLAPAWWWPGTYPSGRGIGGGSAVNGMVVQRPAAGDPAAVGLEAELAWAWSSLAPQTVEPGALSRALAASLPAGGRWRAEAAPLAVRGRRRVTAADLWLRDSKDLTVVGDREVFPEEIAAWAQYRKVLIAAGALRSPRLVGVEPRRVRDHGAAVIDVELPAALRTVGPGVPAATTMLRADDVQVLVMDHTGGDRSTGALIAMSMVDDPDGSVLAGAVAAARDLVATVGLDGSVATCPAPVAHACCTLTGLDPPVPVVDASTLADLPAVTPMLVVAAHARRITLEVLGGHPGAEATREVRGPAGSP